MNIQFKKGILELCVLSILKNKNCYGYELVNEILKFLNISEGTIYPLLRRLRKDQLVTTYLQESNEGPPRKYYQLTQAGLQAHKLLINDWQIFQDSINQICFTEEVNHD